MVVLAAAAAWGASAAKAVLAACTALQGQRWPLQPDLDGQLGLGLFGSAGSGIHLGQLFRSPKRVTPFPTAAIGVFALVSGPAVGCSIMRCWSRL